MIDLGSVIAPKGAVKKHGAKCLSYSVTLPAGEKQSGAQGCGEIALIPLARGETAEVRLEPAKGFDVGAGPGKPLQATVEGGEVGLIIDTRGRPLSTQPSKHKRLDRLQHWLESLDAYPKAAGAEA